MENKLQEMQILEQNLQNILLQKQAFYLELNETQSALSELDNSGEEVFKVVGQLMIRTDKGKMREELLNQEKMLSLRVKTIEKQEKSFTERMEKIREELISSSEK
jgi:prefoldin beta subunit